MEIEEIRQGYDKFMEELAREDCENRRGLQDKIDTEKIFKKYAWTYSKESIEKVKHALNQADGLEKRKLRFLLHELVTTQLGAAVAKQEDELTEIESKAELDWEGKKLPLRMASVVIRDEPQQGKRKQLYELATPFRNEFCKRQAKIWKSIEQESKKLGYGGYLDLHTQLKGVDYPALVKLAKKLLQETADTYSKLHAKYTTQYGLGKVYSFDIGHMMVDTKTKDKFPAEELLPMLREFLKTMKINMDEQKNIIWDTEQRPKKVHRACCYPIRVPQEIYVITQPSGGVDDAMTLFHEAGHAEHHAVTSEKMPLEFRYYGLMSTTETWSYLFTHLFFNPEFYREFTKLNEEEAKGVIEKQQFLNLFFLRRYAGKCIYEYKFWSNDLHKLKNWEETDKQYESMEECYQSIQQEATLAEYGKQGYMLDMDSGFYAFEYFKAWLSEAQVRKHLEKFGRAWWHNEEAVELVKKLWAEGYRMTTEEIVQSLGYEGLRVQELADNLPKL